MVLAGKLLPAEFCKDQVVGKVHEGSKGNNFPVRTMHPQLIRDLIISSTNVGFIFSFVKGLFTDTSWS